MAGHSIPSWYNIDHLRQSSYIYLKTRIWLGHRRWYMHQVFSMLIRSLLHLKKMLKSSRSQCTFLVSYRAYSRRCISVITKYIRYGGVQFFCKQSFDRFVLRKSLTEEYHSAYMWSHFSQKYFVVIMNPGVCRWNQMPQWNYPMGAHSWPRVRNILYIERNFWILRTEYFYHMI